MVRLLSAILVVTASLSFAQAEEETTTTVSLPGLNVKVKTQLPADRAPAPAPAPARTQAPPPRTFGGEQFAIDYSPLGVPGSTIKVVSPEGALAEVWSDDGSLVTRSSVPFAFEGRGDQFYRVILVGADGALLLDKKFEVKRFLGGTLKSKGAPAPAPAAAPTAQGMADADFAALVEAVNDAGFGDEKLGVIETAANSHVFTVEQVGKLVDLLSMSDEKVGVVERTKKKLVDRQNAFKLLEHFTFSADKERVRKLLK
ncbi:MAG: DUF4476 domain-containing protein [Archangium sp.]|nr:DUF4476 domain-containing protein [Archangium sp.]